MSAPEIAGILDELRSLGSEQTLKTYRRHGLEGEAFGVKYGDIEKLARRLRKRPDLASGLWKSGTHEARVLACKIADPNEFDRATFEPWVNAANRILIADLSSLIARSPDATELAALWTTPTQSENSRITGWCIVSALATRDETIPGGWFEPFLDRIATEMAEAPNRLRYALNGALISIGGRSDPALRDAALHIAKRIGKVEIDHGETGCKTPDATAYIRKMWDRRKARAST